MINIKSSQVFLLDSLAVPCLGNVQLRFHFLRHGTSGSVAEVNINSKGSATLHQVQVSDVLGRVIGNYSNINTSQFVIPFTSIHKGVFLIKVLDSQGKVSTSKIQR